MKLSIMIKSNDKKGIQMKHNPFLEGRKFVEKSMSMPFVLPKPLSTNLLQHEVKHKDLERLFV